MRARPRPTIRLVAVLLAVGAGLAALLVLATVPLGGTPGSSPLFVGASPLMGKPAPAIDLPGLDGGRVTLAGYAGRPVILNFWATWCLSCREEFGLLREARETYGSAGLEVVGVVHDDTAEGARAFAADARAAWPMANDVDDTAWETYLGVGLPLTYFIDGAGVVRAISFGALTADGLRQQLATILPPGALETDAPGPTDAPRGTDARPATAAPPAA